MTHRERLMTALSHEQPDSIPLDFGGTVNSSIVVEGYEKLKRHFGIEAENRICQRMTPNGLPMPTRLLLRITMLFVPS